MNRGMESPPRKLTVVTAMIDPAVTVDYWRTWRSTAATEWSGVVVVNGGSITFEAADEYLELIGKAGAARKFEQVQGVVPAFKAGLDAIYSEPDSGHIVALLHDDVSITQKGWDAAVMDWFTYHPNCGLVGFGGAKGVGRTGMYDQPFDPMTLARHDFVSNMRQAEAHGRRSIYAERVAVLDGFSMIGRASLVRQALARLSSLKVVHHAYDVAFGCEARREGWETWMLPIECHHHGGMSAVANPKYAEWAARFKTEDGSVRLSGDQAVWFHAHRQVWQAYRDVLPFRFRV